VKVWPDTFCHSKETSVAREVRSPGQEGRGVDEMQILWRSAGHRLQVLLNETGSHWRVLSRKGTYIGFSCARSPL
jgi:hypothetical protein